ncbi:MAG: thiamine pyrophosphate-binding protein [Chloroflexi bacterium]|nr:thiamine pyrophosphate-binding protein [Chloroflexota bacterium]
MRLADYVVHTLADKGVKHVFMITGGGAMHLNDAFGLEQRIQYVCNLHEQACAMAAEGYARTAEKMAVVCVTSGPGGTNTLSGVLGQWMDSIPALYISGQVRFETTIASTDLPLRQLGDQEANIVDIVRPITKYAAMVTDPQLIRYHLEKAMHLAVSGRPGPVWLDIPLNVQSSSIEETNLKSYDPEEDAHTTRPGLVEEQINEVIERLSMSERPVILAGAGIRLAGAADAFYHLAERLGIPVQVAWDAIDLFPSAHPLYAGRPSTMGQRGANFIFQNADLLLSLACRLNVRQIGYTFPAVARAAYKISVDIDPAELKKPTIKIDLPINADVGEFIRTLHMRLRSRELPQKTAWLSWCKERTQRYPVVLPEYYRRRKPVNPYVFCDMLSERLDAQDVMVSSNGASCVIPIQVMQIKRGQRHIVNSGSAAMGYGLPAAIGACFANGRKRVICFEGDGSIQMNIQELETIAYHRLPVKIFLFNNSGYLSVRTTQNNFFDGHLVGESTKSGVGFPDFVKLAKAYGIPACRITSHSQFEETIERVLDSDGPVLCDVIMDPGQLFSPRTASQRLPDGRMVSSPLEDMFPFLEEREFLSNMIIPRWKAE